MTLNSYFLQGSATEQGLIQDLINDQLKIYGVEVYYIPRIYATENTVMREVIESQFNDAYPIEHTLRHIRDMMLEMCSLSLDCRYKMT